MSLAEPATQQQLRATFEQLIAGPPRDGSGVPSDTGLDEQTVAAIERAWSAGTPAAAEAARQELAMQLDGTHAAEADDQAMAIFTHVMGEGDGSVPDVQQPG
jgi:hypothetical protein